MKQKSMIKRNPTRRIRLAALLLLLLFATLGHTQAIYEDERYVPETDPWYSKS